MPFVAVTNVNLRERDPAEGVTFLNDVLIPRLKTLPGFQTARFVRSLDGQTGVGAVVFDTESNAKASLETMADRPPQAPEIVSSAVYEVVVEV